METPRSSLARLLPSIALLAAGIAATVPTEAVARQSYPTNRCVGVKQREAGKYCLRVLKAWSRWESTGNAAQRDAKIADALARLERSWQRAEAEAADDGAPCDATLDVGDAASAIDQAVAQLVDQVNDGLDLATRRDAACGRKLLDAGAQLCRRLLHASSKYIARPANDAKGRKRNRAQARAVETFETLWTRLLDVQRCPSTVGTADGRSAVQAIADGIVRDTVASPKVDDQQFITISPVGTTFYEGRPLRAVCMNGSPYHFFAKRGSVNKLVVYYQGGGACWDNLTCSAPVCDTSVNPAGGDNPNRQSSGFADLDNPLNPFRDWHAVFVSYCSCDIHFGDAAQDYPLHVEHRGYQNARLVEKWAREHFLDPEVVFVTGSSAGAYGAWFHAPLLHEVWPNAQFHVLADAGNGVITQQFLEEHFPNWNFIGNLPPDIPALRRVLEDGSGIPGYTEVVANLFPETNWAHYTTAFDGNLGGQTGFYAIMLANNPIAALTWWTASCRFNEVMRSQAIATAAAVPSNYRYYIGTGSRHTMWGTNRVYSNTTGGVPTIVDWVEAMLASTGGVADPGWTNVECTNCGLLLPGDPRPNPLAAPFTQVGNDVVIQCGP